MLPGVQWPLGIPGDLFQDPYGYPHLSVLKSLRQPSGSADAEPEDNEGNCIVKVSTSEIA